MTERGRARHVFPGSNTPSGFFSYYDHILRQEDAARILVIKGGPGVGKSTFMRNLGEEMLESGFDVEFHHCSADNNSLDGIVIHSIGVALLDGTAPHVVDPVHPGAVDEILHFGDYWDEKGMRRNRDAIMTTNREVSKRFQRAFRYLAAARSVYDDIEAANRDAMDFGWMNQQAERLIEGLFGHQSVAKAPGKVRRLFGSAITPLGSVNYLPSLFDPVERIVVIEGEPGTGKATLVEKLALAAAERGLDVEAFHCPFDPHKMEHLVIPGASLAVTTSTLPHVWEHGDLVIDTGEALSQGARKSHADDMAEAKRHFQTLFDRAVHALKQAKKLHDDLETYYVPNMRFDAIDTLYAKTRARILAYAKERAPA